MISIVSNLSASQASRNLEIAGSQTEKSIARLSSGNRIIKASDDVAGLAIGTSLKTTVTALKAALLNTSQAQSMLGVADGALEQVAELLQRQKTLATQATAGSLSDSERAYMNLEFQNLKEEIDRLSTTVNFNNINLIDGSLYNPAKLVGDTKTLSTAASGVLSFGLQSTGAFVQPADGDTLTIDLDAGGTNYAAADVTFTFVNTGTSASSSASSLMQIDATGNTTATQFATALVNQINLVKNYSGTDATTLLAKSRLEFFDVSVTNSSITGAAVADSVKFVHKSGGTLGNNVTFGGTNASSNLSLNGKDFAAATNDGLTTVGGTAGVNGSMPAGLASTTAKVYGSTTSQIFQQGTIGDGIITAIRVSEISDNASFIGKIQGFKANYLADNTMDLSIKVGDEVYKANGVRSDYAGATNVTFGSTIGSHGAFTLTFAANVMTNITDQSYADTFAARLDRAFSSVNIMQKREISNYQGLGSVYPTGNTTASGDLTGSKMYFVGDNFTNAKIEDVKITAPATATNDAIIEFTVDGEVYRSGYDYDGSTVLALSGLTTANTLNNTAGSNSGQYGFVNASDPTKFLILDYASATGLALTNQSEVEGAQKALKAALGIGTGDGGNAGLSFQVGTAATDVVNVQIESAMTKDIYLDENMNLHNLSIGSKEGAVAANSIIDNAIGKIISIRANVGALQSRFNYASANISSSMENQDAARGIFLDADIADESSSLAQAQVRLQASISVLAQANQIPQGLLKLMS